MELVVALLILLAGVVLGALLLVRRIAAGHRRDNEVVPGVDTGAPDSWAGAHTREARLHRRLRDAVRSLHAAADVDAGAYRGLCNTLQREAIALDERLVVAAALPTRVRAEPIEQIAAAVDALEEATAAFITGAAAGAGQTPGFRPNAVDEVGERLRHLAEARAELDRVIPDPTAPPPPAPPPTAADEQPPERGELPRRGTTGGA